MGYRPSGKRPLKGYIRVFTEGDETEPRYLAGLCKRKSNLKIEKCGVPKSTFEKWLKRKDKRALNDVGWDKKRDTIWYVCDVDETSLPVLEGLLLLSRGVKGHVAISNPSFELWLLLHFEDASGAKDQKQLESRLTWLLGKEYSKTKFDMEKFQQSITAAVDRARALSPTQSSVPKCPGTTMWALIEAITVPS